MSSSSSSSTNASTQMSSSSSSSISPPTTLNRQAYVKIKHDAIYFSLEQTLDPILLVADNVSINSSALVGELVNFSFDRSPAGLIFELADLGHDIDLDRTGSVWSADNYSKLEISGFTGRIIDLFNQMFPASYGEPLWAAAVDASGHVSMRFGGGIAGTPMLADPDTIPFIPPPSGSSSSSSSV